LSFGHFVQPVNRPAPTWASAAYGAGQTIKEGRPPTTGEEERKGADHKLYRPIFEEDVRSQIVWLNLSIGDPAKPNNMRGWYTIFPPVLYLLRIGIHRPSQRAHTASLYS
jgi:hypothetical protein